MARKRQSAKKMMKKNNTRTLYNSKKRRKSRYRRKKKGGSEYNFNDLMNDENEQIYEFFLDLENEGTFKEVAKKFLTERYPGRNVDLYAFLAALLDRIIYNDTMPNYNNFKHKFFPGENNINEFIDNYSYHLDSELKKYSDLKKLLEEKKEKIGNIPPPNYELSPTDFFSITNETKFIKALQERKRLIEDRRTLVIPLNSPLPSVSV